MHFCALQGEDNVLGFGRGNFWTDLTGAVNDPRKDYIFMPLLNTLAGKFAIVLFLFDIERKDLSGNWLEFLFNFVRKTFQGVTFKIDLVCRTMGAKSS